MRRRNVAIGLVVLAVIAFAAVFVFMPASPVRYSCFGGFACVHEASLSCTTFGFGGIENYAGYYSFTYNCAGFLKPMF